jgi:ABC-2 type transport system permease protein
VAIAQVLLLLGLGILLFQVKMIGNIFAFMAMATLGSAVFLTIGFAIAGWAKDENQATPVAQLIQFPMLFLSGVFFPREGFPAWLQKVTDYLPLTYLVDGLRKIATEGASLWALRGDIIGLVVWGIIVSIIAVRIFRWE